MKYEITFKNPLTHKLSVELILNCQDQDEITLTLPVWRPGRYEAANFSKNLTNLKITDLERRFLKTQKPSANLWKVVTRDIETLKITYEYFAYRMDAGNSWYDNELIYLNFINCLMYDVDRMDESCSIKLDLPPDYNVACAMNLSEDKRYHTKNYYELVDSPLIASKQLTQLNYTVANTLFSIWINGQTDLDYENLISQFKSFSKSQIDTFGDFPEDEYHFLILALPYKHYHGVEHANSTVICIGPGEDLSDENLYKELLGVSSHELFHAWNILKIRPQELLPYKFHEEVCFPTGFVAEGFTTYYGDLLLCRSNVFSVEQYFDELNTLFNRHFWNYGRLNESVVESSLNLWIDGYQTGAPHKKSSIYVEGAMVSLCLDLEIITASDGKKCLDDVMLLLWQKFGKPFRGYSLEDIQSACEEVIARSLESYFNNYVHGTHDKKAKIEGLLDEVGCKLESSANKNFLTKNLGVRGKEANDKFKVFSIAPDSTGEKYFSIGDEIIKIDGDPIDRLTNRLGERTILIERNQQQIEINITIEDDNFYPMYSIEKKENADSYSKDFFEKWLSHPF